MQEIYRYELTWPDDLPEEPFVEITLGLRFNQSIPFEDLKICLEGEKQEPICLENTWKYNYTRLRINYLKLIDNQKMGKYSHLVVYLRDPQQGFNADTLKAIYLDLWLKAPGNNGFITWFFSNRSKKQKKYSVFYPGIDSNYCADIFERGAFFSRENLGAEILDSLYWGVNPINKDYIKHKSDTLLEVLLEETDKVISYFRKTRKESKNLNKFQGQFKKLKNTSWHLEKWDTVRVKEFDDSWPSPSVSLLYSNAASDIQLKIHLKGGEPDGWLDTKLIFLRDGVALGEYHPVSYGEYSHLVRFKKIFFMVTESGVHTDDYSLKGD